MTVKMYCDGPDCKSIALLTAPDWWLVQRSRETFHFHGLPCLAAWAGDSIVVALAATQADAAGAGGGGACSHPWHLRESSRRGGDCPRCGTLAVTEPVPGT
jgi:hypothetical protein